MRPINKLWIGIGTLILFSPLGLILPQHFKSGSAWGEWGSEEMQKLVGYIPKGLAKISWFWKAPLADYTFKGWEEKGLPYLSFAYILSAIAGIAIVVLVVMLIGKVLSKKGE